MSDDSEFQNLTNGAFAQMEQALGQDAYQANVALGKAQAENIKVQGLVSLALAQWIDMKRNALGVLAFVLFLMALPILVWLWRWAL